VSGDEQSGCVLRAEGICRAFPGVRALDDVRLCLRAGEIHALMGQNGAGKSTLIKILTGVHAPDAGTIELDGRRIRPASTLHAQQLGISTVYQEVNLCPNLTVAENIFAGRYPRRPWWRGGGIDWAAVNTEAKRVLSALHLEIDVTRLLSAHPVAIQQMVAIARATSVSARVLILDEPTSSLDADEVKELFAVLDRLRRQGMAILFITHFLDQVYAICDRITVLRNGCFVGEYRTQELSREALIKAMVGREIAAASERTPAREPQADAAAPGQGRRHRAHHAAERGGAAVGRAPLAQRGGQRGGVLSAPLAGAVSRGRRQRGVRVRRVAGGVRAHPRLSGVEGDRRHAGAGRAHDAGLPGQPLDRDRDGGARGGGPQRPLADAAPVQGAAFV
jgi:simple sugar transport system ATP-binding protein